MDNVSEKLEAFRAQRDQANLEQRPFPSVVEPRRAVPDDLVINVAGERGGKGWMVAAIIFAILTLGCAALAAYLWLNQGKQEAVNDDCEEKVAALETETKHDTDVRAAVKLLNEKLAEMLTFDERHFGYYATYDSEPVVVYQLEGVQALVGLTRTYGSYVPIQEGEELTNRFVGSEEVKTALGKLLIENGFMDYEYSGWYDRQYLNAETGVMCAVSEPQLPYSFQCGHVSTANTENLELVKQLGEAMVAAGKGVSYIDATGVEPKTSLVRPYQKVQVNLLGAVGLFYQTDPNEPWHFFAATQGLLPCENYDNEELKKAFAGEACINMENGEVLKVSL